MGVGGIDQDDNKNPPFQKGEAFGNRSPASDVDFPTG